MDVSCDNIVYLLNTKHEERRQLLFTKRNRPRIVVDASLLGYQALGGSIHTSNYVWQICAAFAERNIDVLIICEEKRHHSKRASQHQIAARERAKVELMIFWLELLSLTGSAEKDANKIEDLSKRIQRLEKAQQQGLPEDFDERLYKLSSGYPSQGEGG